MSGAALSQVPVFMRNLVRIYRDDGETDDHLLWVGGQARISQAATDGLSGAGPVDGMTTEVVDGGYRHVKWWGGACIVPSDVGEQIEAILARRRMEDRAKPALVSMAASTEARRLKEDAAYARGYTDAALGKDARADAAEEKS